MKTAWIKEGVFQSYRNDKNVDGVNFIPVVDIIPEHNPETHVLQATTVELVNGVARQRYIAVEKQVVIERDELIEALLDPTKRAALQVKYNKLKGQ